MKDKCYWCGREDLTDIPNLPNSRTKDHIIPKRQRKFHKGESGKTIIACRKCNNDRGDLLMGGEPGTCIKMRAFQVRRVLGKTKKHLKFLI